jgi:AcrR family transcriptional regulator
MILAAGNGLARKDRKPRRTQEERSATARAALLNAAITLIGEKGFAHTTMTDVATHAGLTRGAIHHHFQNRVDLVRAMISEVEQRVVESFSAAAPTPDVSIEQRIDILIDGLGAVTLSPIYLAAMDIWFTSRSDPELRAASLQSVRRYSDHFRQLWQSTFGDEIPEQTISECRRVMVAVSRGLVMSRIFASDRKSEFVTQTFATTRAMVKHYMLAARRKVRK